MGSVNLARLFSRVPEKYIGVISCQDNDEPRLERLKKFRGLRKQHFDMVMKMDAMTKEADELEVKDAVQLASTHAKELMESKEYASQKFVDSLLVDLKTKMFTAIAQVNKWKRVIVSQHDAEEQAKLEYMTKNEREIWQRYLSEELDKAVDDLRNALFVKTMEEPQSSFKTR